MIKIDWDDHRVREWLVEVFGPGVLADVEERALRFGEEAIELIQSLGISAHQAEALVKQVYAKPPGEPMQELGGTTVTLASLCTVTGMNAEDAYANEFARVENPEIIEKIKRKHATKSVVSSRFRESVPVFDYNEAEYNALSDREIFYGPNPFVDLVRKEAKGRKVVIDGKVRTIIGVDAFAKVSEPALGENIGLAVEAVRPQMGLEFDNGEEPIYDPNRNPVHSVKRSHRAEGRNFVD